MNDWTPTKTTVLAVGFRGKIWDKGKSQGIFGVNPTHRFFWSSSPKMAQGGEISLNSGWSLSERTPDTWRFIGMSTMIKILKSQEICKDSSLYIPGSLKIAAAVCTWKWMVSRWTGFYLLSGVFAVSFREGIHLFFSIPHRFSFFSPCCTTRKNKHRRWKL